MLPVVVFEELSEVVEGSELDADLSAFLDLAKGFG